MKALARESDLSISPVSRALNDHPNIGPELKKKVHYLPAQRASRPNPLATGLLRQSTHTIGVIVPDLVTHFFSSVISGIESYASEKGYYIIISSSYESYKKEKDCIENLLNSRVEGMIVSLSYETRDHSQFEELEKKVIPLVFFDRVCLENKVPTVTIDNREAARQITQHFIDTGRKRIAYISGPDFLNISIERKAGYREGLEQNSIPFQDQYLVHSEMNPPSATIATQKLLALPSPPDAIFGINDTVAFAVMKEIRVAGLIVPDDIAVAGFTNDYHATVVHPSLTSITHPTVEMGKSAASLLFNKLEGDNSIRNVKLETKLMIRGSTENKK
ncbi:MAG: LacI family transcriptional regulator [Pirellulales bacterium]|nr:LacI family transcriptional regulator [Pirellulales bacterium]